MCTCTYIYSVWSPELEDVCTLAHTPHSLVRKTPAITSTTIFSREREGTVENRKEGGREGGREGRREGGREGGRQGEGGLLEVGWLCGCVKGEGRTHCRVEVMRRRVGGGG